MINLLKALLILICFTCISFGQTAKTDNTQAKADLIGELQKILAAEVAANPSLPGELLHITAPKQGLDMSFAAGLFDRQSKLPLEPHHLFRVASVTKTFTAASVLRLYEEGKIKLDDPINRHLPKEYTEILEKDGYPTNVITVRQLLTHTSGIHDYGQDPQYAVAVLNDPKHRWTRMEQVQFAMKRGKAHFEPGKGYHYSDTGYILLGEMIERLSGLSLGKAYRTLLDFKKLGLDETYLETLEPVPAGIKNISHPYFTELDAMGIDASHDLYGGGGLVSSVEDLAHFYRALFNQKVFARDSTLQTMLTVPPTNERVPGGASAMGIFQRNISGNVCWGHNGFWGTSAYHCPRSDVTIVRHYNQAEPHGGFIFNNLYEKIADKLKIGMSKAQWREDLQHLARELPKRHKNLFHTVSSKELEKMAAELDAAIPTLEDYQIVVRMQEILARVGDGHTYVRLPPTFKRYPFVLYWFGNELRVVRAVKEYKDALGAKVVKIGDLYINDVQTRIRKLLSQAENEWFVLSNSPFHLVSPEVLQTLGVIPDVSRAAFTFETDEGKQLKLDVIPVIVDGNLNSLLIGAAKEEPLFRQKPSEQFWFTRLPDSQTVYVNFKGFNSPEENIEKLFQMVDANPTKKLVIDMRQNIGGDSAKMRELLIPAIKQRAAINQKGRLFVIVGRRTFSGATTSAIDLRKETNALLVGEPTSKRPNGYHENAEMKLPNSGIEISYSTKYYKLLEEDTPAVMPDKRIDPNWDDYKAGRDAVMDWILSYNQ
jgi:D-alanyl-D-alanine carboxypeptidase